MKNWLNKMSSYDEDILLLKTSHVPINNVEVAVKYARCNFDVRDKLQTNKHYSNLGTIAERACMGQPVKHCVITLRSLPDDPRSLSEYEEGLSIKLILKE